MCERNYAEKTIRIPVWEGRGPLPAWKVIYAPIKDLDGMALAFVTGPYSSERIRWNEPMEAELLSDGAMSYSRYSGYRCFINYEDALTYAINLYTQSYFTHGDGSLFIVPVEVSGEIRFAESRDVKRVRIHEDKCGEHKMPRRWELTHGAPVMLAEFIEFSSSMLSMKGHRLKEAWEAKLTKERSEDESETS